MNTQKVINGLVAYIDENLVPTMTDDQQTIYMIACEWAKISPESVTDLLRGNLATRVFLSLDKEGNIDVDRTIKILKATARRKGTVDLTVPRFGKISLTETDFDEIYRFVKEADR